MAAGTAVTARFESRYANCNPVITLSVIGTGAASIVVVLLGDRLCDGVERNRHIFIRFDAGSRKATKKTVRETDVRIDSNVVIDTVRVRVQPQGHEGRAGRRTVRHGNSIRIAPGRSQRPRNPVDCKSRFFFVGGRIQLPGISTLDPAEDLDCPPSTPRLTKVATISSTSVNPLSSRSRGARCLRSAGITIGVSASSNRSSVLTCCLGPR